MINRPEIFRGLTGRNTGMMAGLLALILLAASCKVMHLEKYPEISADDQLYREYHGTDSSAIASMPWRELFTDTCLQVIIEKAVNNNPDVLVAIARMKKAEAALRQSKAEFYPSLNAGVAANFQSDIEGYGVPESYQIYGSTSWEADVWGKFRSARRANLAALMASQAFRRAVVTELVASVAMNYYNLLALDEQLDITQKTLEKRISNAATMEALRDNDIITSADVVLSQANRYSTEILIPDLKQRIFETENTLSLLMGQVPGPIVRTTLDHQEVAGGLSAGVPAQILSNRPDVVEAEYRMRYFYESAKSARAYFYPSLTITARGGLTETSLNALFNQPVFFWNILGGIVQPVFNYGINRQRFISATADFEESHAIFRKILLNAGGEVADAMHSYETASDKMLIREKQIGYLEKAVDYTTELLKYTSNTSYIDVLTSEVTLLSAQLNGVNDKVTRLQSVVALYRSLGGGWR